MARPKRQYSDSDKASALAALEANKGNVSKTARQLKIPGRTLQDWVDNRGVHPEIADIREVKKKELAERLEEIAHALVDSMPNKIEAASLRDTAVSLGIAVEKAQLLKGEPTAISKSLTDEERAQRAAEILERGKLRLVNP